MVQAKLRKARVLLEVWFAHMSAYRAEIVIWILTGSLPLIMLAVWIGKAVAAGGSIEGYTTQGFAAYFLGAWLTQQCIVAWVSWELDFQIRMGGMSPKLMRPLDPFWEHLSMHVTERMVRTPIWLVVITAGLFIVPGTVLTPDIGHALAFVLAAANAFLIRFLIAYCVGILSFWFDQATAIDELYFIVAAFLTGSFAPLDFYPPAVQRVLEWLPFPYIIYHPVRILNGAANGTEILRILAMQLLWVGIFAIVRAVLWRRGLARYGAVGA